MLLILQKFSKVTRKALGLFITILGFNLPTFAMTCEDSLKRISFNHDIKGATNQQTLAKTFIFESEKYFKGAGIKYHKDHGPEETVWFIDGVVDTKKDYETDFSDILAKLEIYSPINYFENLLRSRKTLAKGANVADLFGSGFFIENQTLADSITGLRFGAYSRGSLPMNYPAAKVPVEILGDIINPNTWDKLDKSISVRGIPSFDIVVMRPVGGWWAGPWSQTAEDNINALKYILGNAMLRLSPDGYFFFKIHFENHILGSLSDNPLLKEIVHDIESVTTNKLILFSQMDEEVEIKSLSGVLLPK